MKVQENEIKDALICRFQVLRLCKLVKAFLTIKSFLDAGVRIECLDEFFQDEYIVWRVINDEYIFVNNLIDDLNLLLLLLCFKRNKCFHVTQEVIVKEIMLRIYLWQI